MIINNILLDIDNVLVGLVYIIACFIILAIAKYAYGVFHKGINVDDELVEKDNLSFAVSQVGYYSGILLVLGATLAGVSNGLVNDVIDMGIYGLIGIVLLNWSMWWTDKVVLPKFNVRKEIIEDKNVGTGVVEGAVAFGNGLILFGVFAVEQMFSPQVLIYFVGGQFLFLLAAKIYNVITPYDIHEHIEKDNVAVGVGFSGAIIAVANIVRFALSAEFEGWQDLGLVLLFDFAIALALLPMMRMLVDKILLPKRKLTDEIVNQDKPNVGAALIEAFAYIGGSILITWCL
jgi:uncharacterized membrane protein YjfL (UPF0719 family)